MLTVEEGSRTTDLPSCDNSTEHEILTVEEGSRTTDLSRCDNSTKQEILTEGKGSRTTDLQGVTIIQSREYQLKGGRLPDYRPANLSKYSMVNHMMQTASIMANFGLS